MRLKAGNLKLRPRPLSLYKDAVLFPPGVGLSTNLAGCRLRIPACVFRSAITRIFSSIPYAHERLTIEPRVDLGL